MAWVTLIVGDLKQRLAGAELESLQTAALADGQSDPVGETLAQVIDEVRGYIAAAGVTLGVGSTVPSKLIVTTLNLARYRICSRLPVASFLTESRKQEYQDALRLLEQVAAGRFRVEEPAEAATEQAGASSPQFDTQTRVFKPADQEGV
jgi:phage gp36-like protein